jgi:hypothetical protein
VNKLWFKGFPTDVGWRFVEIEPQDHKALFYAKDDSWISVDVPKLLKWVEQSSMYPGQETRKEKLRKLFSKRYK